MGNELVQHNVNRGSLLLVAGVKYPLRWIQQIKSKSTDKAEWRVLIDAAAYVPTQPLDLRKVNPDFVSMSFYKMFGYPTVGLLKPLSSKLQLDCCTACARECYSL